MSPLNMGERKVETGQACDCDIETQWGHRSLWSPLLQGSSLTQLEALRETPSAEIAF